MSTCVEVSEILYVGCQTSKDPLYTYPCKVRMSDNSIRERLLIDEDTLCTILSRQERKTPENNNGFRFNIFTPSSVRQLI